MHSTLNENMEIHKKVGYVEQIEKAVFNQLNLRAALCDSSKTCVNHMHLCNVSPSHTLTPSSFKEQIHLFCQHVGFFPHTIQKIRFGETSKIT